MAFYGTYISPTRINRLLNLQLRNEKYLPGIAGDYRGNRKDCATKVKHENEIQKIYT